VSCAKMANQYSVWYVDLGRSKKALLDGGAQWHHLANTIKFFFYSGDVAFLLNYFDHLFY